MKNFGEMLVDEYFKLSTGHIALVGKVKQNSTELLTECKAELYIGNAKCCSINIIGEDKFIRVDEKVRQNRRAVRTSEDIYDNLKSHLGKPIKLLFYKD